MSGFINDNVTVGMLRDAMHAKAIPEGAHLKPPVSMLGFGLPGGQPPGGLLGGGGGTYGGTGMEGGSTRGRDRNVLRRGFGRFKPRESLEKHRHSVVRIDKDLLHIKNVLNKTFKELIPSITSSIGDYYKVTDPSEIERFKTVVTNYAPQLSPIDIYKNNKWALLLYVNSLSIVDKTYINSGGKSGSCLVIASLSGLASIPTSINQTTLNSFFAPHAKTLIFPYISGVQGAPAQHPFPQFINMAVEKTLEDRKNPRIITPFRQAYNAGDVAGTVDQRTLEPAPNQVNGIAPVNSLRKYERSRGAASGGKSLFTGNPRYVYDSSDYIRYRKLVSKNKNYNDLSFGGDESNASQVAIMRNF